VRRDGEREPQQLEAVQPAHHRCHIKLGRGLVPRAAPRRREEDDVRAQPRRERGKVSVDKLETLSKGSEEAKKGGTDEDMKKERRVELVIIKQK
jgi:hypothetical protein